MPNYRNVLKIYKLERELAPDDVALLNTLRGMTDAERELLAETLGPPAKGKVVKPEKKRNIEHCNVCNYTRRAVHHKDTGHKDYHEFDSGGTKKSARAVSLASKIAGGALSGNHKPPSLCDFEIDGKVCHGEEGDGIHDKSLGYGAYHPFVSSSPARSAKGQSSTSGPDQSSEVVMENASVATGD